jgi:hypothetical protein
MIDLICIITWTISAIGVVALQVLYALGDVTSSRVLVVGGVLIAVSVLAKVINMFSRV